MQEILINVLFKTIDNVFARDRAVFECVGDKGQASLVQSLRRLFIHTPACEHIDIFNQRPSPCRIHFQNLFFGHTVLVCARDFVKTHLRRLIAFQRAYKPVQNGCRKAVRGMDTSAVKAVGVIIQEHGCASVVQRIKLTHKVCARLTVIDTPKRKREILGKVGIRANAFPCLVDFIDRLELAQNFILFQGRDCDLVQFLHDRIHVLIRRILRVACFQPLPKLHIFLGNIHELFELLRVLFHTRIQATICVIEHKKLLFIVLEITV